MATILLVDDNAELLGVQAKVLRESGHHVTVADGGKEAMRLVRSAHFDMVITDVVMPDEDGIAVIMELRQEFPKIKIIAISGGGRMDAEGYLEIAEKLGASMTLGKPFSGKALADAVASVMNPSVGT